MLILINLAFGFAIAEHRQRRAHRRASGGLGLGAILRRRMSRRWPPLAARPDATRPARDVAGRAQVLVVGVVAIAVVVGLDGRVAAAPARAGSLRMFATLLGALPRPPLADDAAPEALLDAVLELQVDHGLEPLTDGGWPLDAVDRRRVVAVDRRRADRLVKAVVDGPFTTGRPAADPAARGGLADAGCAWIELPEPAADDRRERGRPPPIRRRPRRADRGLAGCTFRWPSPGATRRRRARDDPRRRLRQPRPRPHRRPRQLAARRGGPRSSGSSAGRSRRAPGRDYSPELFSGPRPTRPRRVVVGASRPRDGRVAERAHVGNGRGQAAPLGEAARLGGGIPRGALDRRSTRGRSISGRPRSVGSSR